MFKTLTPIALTIVVLLQTLPGYCESMSFQVSVTLPPHVMLNNLASATESNNAYQLVQTQTMVRNNKTMNVTSIVVP